MAMCKECVHYNVCGYHIDEETFMTTEECSHFKNKADFVEVKHGHWEEVQGGAFRCSECHRGAVVDIFNGFVLTKHCHNCGAKMDVENTNFKW